MTAASSDCRIAEQYGPTQGKPQPWTSPTASAACVCGEINTRHCPVHGQDDTTAATTVLACGSRGWENFRAVRDRLASFVDDRTTVFHGGAAGADRHVSAACVELGLDCYAFPPRYDEHGKAAPHIRNDQMLAQADLVVAFWDGKSRGTKSVIDKARKLGIPTEVISL